MTEHFRPQLKLVEVGAKKSSTPTRTWSPDRLLGFAREIARIENHLIDGINGGPIPCVQTTEICNLGLVTETPDKK